MSDLQNENFLALRMNNRISASIECVNPRVSATIDDFALHEDPCNLQDNPRFSQPLLNGDYIECTSDDEEYNALSGTMLAAEYS